jgi:hypothetical protein
MKVKTSELAGIQLDWAVAKAEGISLTYNFPGYAYTPPGKRTLYKWTPTTNWKQGGPIIEREHMDLSYRYGGREDWSSWTDERQEEVYEGPTPLIAAMRCYVASKLGDEVEIP